jgi:hypothetical protein
VLIDACLLNSIHYYQNQIIKNNAINIKFLRMEKRKSADLPRQKYQIKSNDQNQFDRYSHPPNHNPNQSSLLLVDGHAHIIIRLVAAQCALHRLLFFADNPQLTNWRHRVFDRLLICAMEHTCTMFSHVTHPVWRWSTATVACTVGAAAVSGCSGANGEVSISPRRLIRNLSTSARTQSNNC